ncbi:MAG: site specific recombinase [uncultured bacterium]|nr:MAG: site specific recombinase [uncultured bacterium]HBH17904.1 hypothetical protein [Cyanobacteria bacterium UBA9579]
MFSIAVDNGWIEQNPCSKIKPLKEDNIIERHLQKDEELRLLNACTGAYEYMKAILICAIHTGCRKGEILNLKWENIDLQNRYITLTETKSGKKRDIPISYTLLKELESLEINKKSNYVFANPESGEPYYDIKRPFKAILERAEIEELRFHDLRHTAATRMVASGTDIVTVQDILGHQDLKTTSRYSHPDKERKFKAVEALDKYNELLNVSS